ncbi:unnamed protein product [Gordionus sp. m RMFG-2023]|uniref:protein HIRA-like isoform X2 n=1 Tax=Gordionus sp. m RMFG-2023 TaxID=3053472 RepID=UPI0030E40C59
MKLLKPQWVNHNGCAIYSIDIHPNLKRFATGGLGNECGKIVIWNMDPVVNEDKEKNDAIPKILCQMDNHLSCVNCVRWSNSGEYLASGSDDKLIIIWKMAYKNISKDITGEYWKSHYMLRAHVGDVLDVSWSPHDAYLATCSVDNTIIIWDALKFPDIIHVIKGHTGLVKGATWDPTGKYLATQSEDRTLRIWRTANWKQEVQITKPFKECAGTTHVLRLGWSPDGHYIVSAHAMNNSGPTAQIIERNGWKVNMDFVGHRKAITCVRFNPNILMKKIKKGTNKPQQYSVCALGSKDRSLSIWMTALKRPLVVIHSLFMQPIMDISWGSNGKYLLTCSLDGTVAYVELDSEEIGVALSKEEKLVMQKKIYGSEYDLLNPLEKNFPRHKKDNANVTKKLYKDSFPQKYEKPLDRQIELRLPGGKRRITPIFIPNFEETLLISNGIAQIFNTSAAKKSNIKVEKRASLTTNLDKQQDLSSHTNILANVKESRCITKTATLNSSHKQDQFNFNVDAINQKFQKQLNPEPSNSPYKYIHNVSNKNLIIESNTQQLSIPYLQNSFTLQITNKSLSPITLEIKNCKLNDDQYVTTISAYYLSDQNSHDKELQLQKLKWRNSISISPVNLIACNEDVVIASLHKFPGIVYFCLKSGRKLLPPLMLSSHISYLFAKNSYVLAITSKAKLYLWETSNSYFDSVKCIINDITATPIQTEIDQLDDIDITSHGNPILHFCNDHTYTYDDNLRSWLLIDMKDDILEKYFTNMYMNSVKDDDDPMNSLYCLKKYQNTSNQDNFNIASILQSDTSVVKICLKDTENKHLSRFLQNQVTTSYQLKSQSEFLFWFRTMVKHIIKTNSKTELHGLILSLSSKSFGDKNTINKDLFQIIFESMESSSEFKPWIDKFKNMIDYDIS